MSNKCKEKRAKKEKGLHLQEDIQRCISVEMGK